MQKRKLGAANLALSSDDLREINDAASKITVQGRGSQRRSSR